MATGEIKVWVRGDSQEGKRAGEGAELKIKGRKRVPFTIQGRGKLERASKARILRTVLSTLLHSPSPLSYNHRCDTDESTLSLFIIVSVCHRVTFDRYTSGFSLHRCLLPIS